MTVEVFDSLASSQGLQKSGWFAKIVKDKFNIKLNIIAPNVSGGDTVFDTRSASGNLGDLVIVGTGNGRLNKLVKAKLIEDMTPYYSSMKNVKKYDSAVKSIAKQAGKDGVWGVPQGVSSQSPTDPSEGNESAAAPYIRWDIYRRSATRRSRISTVCSMCLSRCRTGLARIPARTTSTPCHCSRIGTAM